MYNEITEDFSNDEFPKCFGNDIYFSNLITEEHQKEDPFTYISNISIKFLRRGIEYYKLENVEKELKGGFYFIVNNQQEITCERDKIKNSEGVSIFLRQDLMNDVFTCLEKDLPIKMDNPFETNTSPIFFEDIFFYKNDLLGEYLNKITLLHSEYGESDLLEEEVYFNIAEKLLLTHSSNLLTVDSIKRKKKTTREEIYRRLLKGKSMIEDCLFQEISIDRVARHSTLSKYQFIRLFSQVFGISPYRYLLKRRIEEAGKILHNSNKSIKEVSLITGFSDVSAFSKRFKLEMGVSPSNFGHS